MMEGFLPYIQSSIMNHDIPDSAPGMLAIKKWSMVAESFQPVVSTDTAQLQHQIKEFSEKLKNTQMRMVSENRKTVQFAGHEHGDATGTSSGGNWKCTQGVSGDGPNFSEGVQGYGNSRQHLGLGGDRMRTSSTTAPERQYAEQRNRPSRYGYEHRQQQQQRWCFYCGDCDSRCQPGMCVLPECCWNCGNEPRCPPGICEAVTATCAYCGITGHFSSKCRKRLFE